MIAVVNIQGQQFKVSAGQKLYVQHLSNRVGDPITFDQVLLVANGDSTTVGTPTVPGANVRATVLEHVKADKVIVYKKKRRKGYEKRNGHRQRLSQIRIESIELS